MARPADSSYCFDNLDEKRILWAIRSVPSAAAPSLIVHGDTTVSIPEGETMHAVLTKAGVPASFIRIEERGTASGAPISSALTPQWCSGSSGTQGTRRSRALPPPAGIYVFSPKRERIGFAPVADRVSKCAFEPDRCLYLANDTQVDTRFMNSEHSCCTRLHRCPC